jgi:hypothetical protein
VDSVLSRNAHVKYYVPFGPNLAKTGEGRLGCWENAPKSHNWESFGRGFSNLRGTCPPKKNL